MSDPEFVEKADPDEVFAALADDTRVSILRALWDADDGDASFSDLRSAVGMRDSGQFNYHLDKLVGRFVTRTDDGYELTQAGQQIIGAIETGAYTMGASIDPITLDHACPACGGTRTLHYEDEVVRVECDSCPVTYQYGVPPAAFAGHDREAFPDVASRYLRTTFRHIDDGFCSFCDGHVEPSIASVREIDPPVELPDDLDADGDDSLRNTPLIRYDCTRCGATPTVGLDFILLDHPAVVGFYYDHGIDLREQSIWELDAMNPDRQEIRSHDPFRATVSYRIDGDERTVVVDDDLDVVAVE